MLTDCFSASFRSGHSLAQASLIGFIPSAGSGWDLLALQILRIFDYQFSSILRTLGKMLLHP